MRTSQQEKTDPDRLPAHRLKIRNAGEIDASQYYGNVEMLNAALGAAKPIPADPVHRVPTHPLNVILYGPPDTGKTYQTAFL